MSRMSFFLLCQKHVQNTHSGGIRSRRRWDNPGSCSLHSHPIDDGSVFIVCLWIGGWYGSIDSDSCRYQLLMAQFVHIDHLPEIVDFIEIHETGTLVSLLIGLPPTAIVAFLAHVWWSGVLIDVDVAIAELALVDV